MQRFTGTVWQLQDLSTRKKILHVIGTGRSGFVMADQRLLKTFRMLQRDATIKLRLGVILGEGKGSVIAGNGVLNANEIRKDLCRHKVRINVPLACFAVTPLVFGKKIEYVMTVLRPSHK